MYLKRKKDFTWDLPEILPEIFTWNLKYAYRNYNPVFIKNKIDLTKGKSGFKKSLISDLKNVFNLGWDCMSLLTECRC